MTTLPGCETKTIAAHFIHRKSFTSQTPPYGTTLVP